MTFAPFPVVSRHPAALVVVVSARREGRQEPVREKDRGEGSRVSGSFYDAAKGEMPITVRVHTV